MAAQGVPAKLGRFWDRAYIRAQRLLPQQFVSLSAGKLARAETGVIKQLLIRLFCARYQVDLDDAARQKIHEYKSFNDFFTRELKPDARPLAPDPRDIIAPADGVVSQAGLIKEGTLIHAKGHEYFAVDLVGGEISTGQRLRSGSFATVYLAPSSYHRVHAPVSGHIRAVQHVPGSLLSVNERTTHLVPELFRVNERVVVQIETPKGLMIVIMVGALLVGSMELTFCGLPLHPRKGPLEIMLPPEGIAIERGEELGRFNMGSTVIMLAEPGAIVFNHLLLRPGAALRVGAPIGRFVR